MDDTTHEAVRAFYRMHKATSAALSDPQNPGAQETLSNAAHEANAAMNAAGLLALAPHELFDLVRQEYPDFDPTA